ncbi:hypothetical protein EVAR_66278_1 [Eumeta japonica]|uniref:Uncharacterized protein n=1 Tax=Eumeta variegata TaxID=151549 RepID=A0A4C1YQ18_EUMVA|nr:hypothetical protein EVAR_66278_1 [Eumeta japonica]
MRTRRRGVDDRCEDAFRDLFQTLTKYVGRFRVRERIASQQRRPLRRKSCGDRQPVLAMPKADVRKRVQKP